MSSYCPDMSWTKSIPQKKTLNCVAVADETFIQADRKLSLVERTGIDREKIRVAAFLPHLPGVEVDLGCRRYASYMGKKFRQHGLDFRIAAGHGVANDHEVRLGSKVLLIVAGDDLDLPFREEGGHRRIDIGIRAGDAEAALLHRRRRTGHRRAADAAEVDALDFSEHEKPRVDQPPCGGCSSSPCGFSASSMIDSKSFCPVES